MTKMAILVLADGSKVVAVLESWARLGIAGATILDSSGIGRQLAGHDNLPLIPSLRVLLRAQEHTHRTIFSVISDDFDIAGLLRTTETVIGRLADPHTGILIILPVLEVYGLRENEKLFIE